MREGVGSPSEAGHGELGENNNRMLGLFLMG